MLLKRSELQAIKCFRYPGLIIQGAFSIKFTKVKLQIMHQPCSKNWK